VNIESGSFTMSGGTVSGNTANGTDTYDGGGGVYLDSGTFTMTLGAAVHTGNPVYLASGKIITLSGTLTANPAANIETTGSSGTPVLGDDSVTGGNDITEDDNYRKFWLNGASDAAGDKIGVDGKIQ
jgi:hypothetical protein